MKRLIIYDVPIGHIEQYTNEDDILVNAGDIHHGEMHHGERYQNALTISALFYGHMTENEKRTAQNLVKANAVNLNAALGKVHFVEGMEDVREVLV